MNGNALLAEQALILTVAGPPQFVSPAGYSRFAVWIDVDSTSAANLADVGFLQSTSSTGTPSKALATRNVSVVTADKYVSLEADPAGLDVAGGYTYLAVTYGTHAANVNSAVYVLFPAEYAKSV